MSSASATASASASASASTASESVLVSPPLHNQSLSRILNQSLTSTSNQSHLPSHIVPAMTESTESINQAETETESASVAANSVSASASSSVSSSSRGSELEFSFHRKLFLIRQIREKLVKSETGKPQTDERPDTDRDRRTQSGTGSVSVISGLFIGALASTRSAPLLLASGIGSILSVGRDLPCFHRSDPRFLLFSVSACDSPSADLLSHFWPAIRFIHRTRRKRNRDELEEINKKCNQLWHANQSSMRPVALAVREKENDTENSAVKQQDENQQQIEWRKEESEAAKETAEHDSDGDGVSGRVSGSVLVHCFAGVSRSATLVLCYLLYLHYYLNDSEVQSAIRSQTANSQPELESASVSGSESTNSPLILPYLLQYLQTCRSVVRPNSGFLSQLAAFEQELIHDASNFKNRLSRNGNRSRVEQPERY